MLSLQQASEAIILILPLTGKKTESGKLNTLYNIRVLEIQTKISSTLKLTSVYCAIPHSSKSEMNWSTLCGEKHSRARHLGQSIGGMSRLQRNSKGAW